MDNRMRSQEMAKKYKERMVGKRYHHFKGNIYIVIDIAVHSETEELIVIYKSCDNPSLTWARPFKMFISPVDREKYPYLEQKMRFEEVVNDDEERE